MEVKNIIAIVIIATIIGSIATVGYNYYEQQNAINRWVDINGGVHYNHPSNAYEIAVEEANNICPVYEKNISDNDIGNVQGQTTFNGNTGKVISISIEVQEPAIVYHEMFHAMHNFNDPNNTEPNADAYAQERGYYIHDASY